MNRKWIIFGGIAAVAAVLAFLLWPRGVDDRGGGARATGGAGGAATRTTGGAAVARGGVDGVVVDAGGAPVAGAVVRVAAGRGGADEDDDALAPTARTGRDGRFAIDAAAGEHTVTASAAGHAPAETTAAVAAGARASVELRLGLGGVVVKGVVADATGGTVDGAQLILAPEAGVLRADGRRALAAHSGADGAFALGVTPGRYRVTTSHPEYVPDVRTLEVGPGGGTLDVALVPGGVVEGTVRDRASGAAVGGARVAYSREVVRDGPMGQAATEERGRGTVTAGSDGRFRVAGLGAGRILLTATTADDRASDEPAEVLLGIAETAADVDVFVAPALAIAGRVVDEAGAPVAGATVMVSARGEAGGQRTDADGRFRAQGLQVGRYHLIAEADDALASAPVEVELVDRSVDAVTLTVKRGAFVTGRVDPAGVAEVFVRPPDEADFKLGGSPAMMRLELGGGPRTRTAPDGSYRLGPFAPGPVRLGARAADGRRGELDVEVPTAGLAGAVITLQARGSIAGRVVGGGGAPVPDAVVSLKRRATGPSRTVIVNGLDLGADRAPCDSQGRFVIAGLDAGSWELTVLDGRGGAMAFDRRGKQADVDAPEVVELAVDEQKQGVELQVQVNDGEIAGVVVGPDGKAVPDAWVSVSAAMMAMTGAPGGRLPGGARRGPAPDDGGSAGARPGPRPDGPRPGDPGPDGPVPGGPDDEGPRSMMVAEIVTSDAGDLRAGEVPPVLTDSAGRFVVRGLRHGRYRVAAEGLRGGARGALDDVETGTDVTVKLRTLSLLRGTVTRAGKPVVDYRVTVEGPTRKGRAVHDDGGAFSLQGLDPGTYQVLVKARDGSGSATATVEAGKEVTVAIELRGDGTITGTMLDAAGAPVAGAMVVVTPRQPPGETMIALDEMPPMTGADGGFRVSAEPGPRTLLILGDQGPLIRRDVDVVDGQVLELGTLRPDPDPDGPPAP